MQLPNAPTALVEAIARCEEMVARASRIPLDSRKNLEKAAEAIQAAAALQERVGDRVRGLSSAIATVSDRLLGVAEALQKRSAEIQERSAETSALLARFDAARQGREGDQRPHRRRPLRADGAAPPERMRETTSQLDVVDARMNELVERAAELRHAADAAGIGADNTARQADALRQRRRCSLRATRVRLLREGLRAGA